MTKEEARQIKMRVRSLGLTAKALAERLGYRKSTIYKFMSGNYASKTMMQRVLTELERLEKTLKGGE